MHDWDDIRYFLAAARTGTLSGAATELGVNHSTVFRRINQLEERIGARLFERHREGYTLTAAGETMRGSAERVEAEMATLERQVVGEDVRLTGTVRLTAPDDISERLLPERLAAFREAYPGILLEMIVADRFLNLSRRDADVAFRPSRDPGDTLVGRRLCAVAVAVYRRRDAFTGATALRDAPVVSGDDSLAHTDSVKWMESQAGERIVLRANTMAGRLYAARAGIGIAALPCFSADPDPMLVRVTDPIPEMENELWLLTHPDLRNTARIKAFMEFMAASLASDRDLLEGRRASP
jgi:DNA-binding transcriptional LysR family regulator